MVLDRMLKYLSAKWIPFYAYTLLSGHFGDKFLENRDCENLMLKDTVVHGDPSSAKVFEDLAADLDLTLEDLSLPSLKIYQVPGQLASFFLYDSVFIGTKELGENPEKLKIIFVHELAHSLFRKHFRIAFDGEILTKATIVNRHFRATGAKKKALESIYRNMLAYEEVFADAVAVLYFDNPEIIAQAHGFPSALELGLSAEFMDEETLRSVKFRELDFTAHIDFQQWERMGAAQFGLDKSSYRRYWPYKELAPVRGALWRKYFEVLPKAKRHLFLKAYLAATSEHLLIRGWRAANDESETNSAVNIEFLSILQRQLQISQSIGR